MESDSKDDPAAVNGIIRKSSSNLFSQLLGCLL